MVTVFRSPMPDVVIPDEPLTPVVFRHAADRADKTAVVDGPTGRSYTYAQLHTATLRAAGGLAGLGFGKGDVLGLLAPNLPEYAIVFHAVAMTGGTITTINPSYHAEEIEFQLDDAGASILVAIPAFLDTVLEVASTLGIQHVFVLGDDDRATPFASLMAAEPLTADAGIDPAEDVVALPYSSGTTGLPKGVMLTHRNLVANLAQGDHVMELGDDEIVLAVLPFFHIYGMEVLMNAVLYHGATAVTMPRFDLAEFLQLIEDHGVTRVYAVPPIILALAKHPLVDEFDVSSLRVVFSGAAPLGAEIEQAAARRLGVSVVQGYGLTETSPVTHATTPEDAKSGSIGFLLPNTEVRIVDPATDEDLGVDEEGEIWIRGPQVMKGYLNNPDATRNCIDGDGWFRTGDIGKIDGDGYWFITDRLKELIKYKGFQVPPAELEALLLTHPSVMDSAVIGIPDTEAGELPKAFVVLRPDSDTTAEDIKAFVTEHVATYKRLHEVEFIDEIPKSASGKILRRMLRDT